MKVRGDMRNHRTNRALTGVKMTGEVWREWVLPSSTSLIVGQLDEKIEGG